MSKISQTIIFCLLKKSKHCRLVVLYKNVLLFISLRDPLILDMALHAYLVKKKYTNVKIKYEKQKMFRSIVFHASSNQFDHLLHFFSGTFAMLFQMSLNIIQTFKFLVANRTLVLPFLGWKVCFEVTNTVALLCNL